MVTSEGDLIRAVWDDMAEMRVGKTIAVEEDFMTGDMLVAVEFANGFGDRETRVERIPRDEISSRSGRVAERLRDLGWPQ